MKRTSNPLTTDPRGVPLAVLPAGCASRVRAGSDAAAAVESATLMGCGT